VLKCEQQDKFSIHKGKEKDVTTRYDTLIKRVTAVKEAGFVVNQHGDVYHCTVPKSAVCKIGWKDFDLYDDVVLFNRKSIVGRVIAFLPGGRILISISAMSQEEAAADEKALRKALRVDQVL
jgi:hypothetical protein